MIEDIQEITFNIFRNWKYRVKQDYPDKHIQILDEHELTTDVQHSIDDALKALLKEEKKSKRKKSGYDYGFFLGFMQGNLNTQWVNKYLARSSEVYKELMLFKAIHEYLKLEELALVKVNSIYEELMLTDSNFLFTNLSVVTKKINEYKIDEILEVSEDELPIERFLKNNIKERTLQIVNFERSNYVPELDRYFSEDRVRTLIDSFEKER